MRRDYVTFEIRHAEDGHEYAPTVAFSFDGPTNALTERLTTPAGAPLESDSIDVAFRLQASIDEDDATGVLSITNRLTGEFILEANANSETVEGLVSIARQYDPDDEDEGRYRVEIDWDDETFVSEKRTLLVYDQDGNLRRKDSLIPSGVEL